MALARLCAPTTTAAPSRLGSIRNIRSPSSKRVKPIMRPPDQSSAVPYDASSGLGTITLISCMADLSVALAAARGPAARGCSRLVDAAEGRVRVGMAEGVQGFARFDLDLERVAGLEVEDRDDDLIGGLVPEQSNVDAVAVAAVELSDHRSGGVPLGLEVEERIGSRRLDVAGEFGDGRHGHVLLLRESEAANVRSLSHGVGSMRPRCRLCALVAPGGTLGQGPGAW